MMIDESEFRRMLDWRKRMRLVSGEQWMRGVGWGYLGSTPSQNPGAVSGGVSNLEECAERVAVDEADRRSVRAAERRRTAGGT